MVCWNCPRRCAGCGAGCKDFKQEREARQKKAEADFRRREGLAQITALLIDGAERAKKNRR